MSSVHDYQIGWTVLIVRLPSEPSRHRVAVWRELRRVGAIQLGQGSWALPAAPAFADTVGKLVGLVAEHEGEVLALTASAADQPTSARIRESYDKARLAEWVEFESECTKCVEEIEREIAKEKFTLAELDEEEQNVDRVRRWHRELSLRDVFSSVSPEKSQAHLDLCTDALDRFTTMVYATVGLS
ncbi:MAG: Chromate resistance protein ChrB [Ilumatobacteraceae bacterium]